MPGGTSPLVDDDALAADRGRGVCKVVGAHPVVEHDLSRERDPDFHPELILPAATGELPVVSVQDEKATFDLFQKAFCRVDWRLFDPATVSWRFDGERYVGALNALN